MDNILKEELGPLYIGIPSLYKVFFRGVEGLKEASATIFKKYKEGNNLLYRAASVTSLKYAKECRVLK